MTRIIPVPGRQAESLPGNRKWRKHRQALARADSTALSCSSPRMALCKCAMHALESHRDEKNDKCGEKDYGLRRLISGQRAQGTLRKSEWNHLVSSINFKHEIIESNIAQRLDLLHLGLARLREQLGQFKRIHLLRLE